MKNGKSGFVLVGIDPSFKTSHTKHKLPDGVTTVGRDESQCDFIIKDKTVSRVHAKIEVNGLQATVFDLNSVNGTWVNNRRVEKSILAFDIELKFGTYSFLVRSPETADDPIDPDLETVRAQPPADKEKEIGAKTIDLADYKMTPAQERVFRRLIDGQDSQKQIAAKLNISKETVHTHVREIFKIFGVHKLGELIAKIHKPRGDDEKKKSG